MERRRLISIFLGIFPLVLGGCATAKVDRALLEKARASLPPQEGEIVTAAPYEVVAAYHQLERAEAAFSSGKGEIGAHHARLSMIQAEIARRKLENLHRRKAVEAAETDFIAAKIAFLERKALLRRMRETFERLEAEISVARKLLQSKEEEARIVAQTREIEDQVERARQARIVAARNLIAGIEASLSDPPDRAVMQQLEAARTAIARGDAETALSHAQRARTLLEFTAVTGERKAAERALQEAAQVLADTEKMTKDFGAQRLPPDLKARLESVQSDFEAAKRLFAEGAYAQAAKRAASASEGGDDFLLHFLTRLAGNR